MQLKTSCCNRAVVRKDLTRFAPVWGLYTLALLLGIFLMVDEQRYVRFAVNLTNLPQVMAVVNLGYALLIAQLLFGDLYMSRSCYALHAMPLRRETWLGSHIVSGLVMSLVPTFVMSLIATVLSFGNAVDKAWMLPWYGFAAANMQYLFFFGLAVLCSFAAGNRLGMILCYGVVNFLAACISIVVNTLYIPLLYGVVFSEQAFFPYMPIIQMSSFNMLDIPGYHDQVTAWERANRGFDLHMNFTVGEGWGYLAVAALIGIGMMVIALFLYRRRKLEATGDLLAVKVLEPVFQVLMAVACAYGFQFVHDEVAGIAYSSFSAFASGSEYLKERGYFIFMAVGLIVGWFTAKMLLERSTRVFRRGSIPGIVALAAVLALSFVGTAVDPLGLETWLPNPADVDYVGIASDTYYEASPMKRPGDLDKITELHGLALTDRITAGELRKYPEGRTADRICLEYKLKNGSTVKRRYYFWMDSPTAEAAQPLLSRPEVVLTGYGREFDFSKMLRIGIQNEYKDISFREQADFDSFLAAARADCEAGTMAQGAYYHCNVGYFADPENERRYDNCVSVGLSSETDYAQVNIYPDSANCIQWLQNHGVLEKLNYEIMEGDYFQHAEYISTKYQNEALG